ncbi:unnamed protein product, partial [Ilex paraguariensis]
MRTPACRQKSIFLGVKALFGLLLVVVQYRVRVDFSIPIESFLDPPEFMATGDKDVRFKVLYCGICHSDLHMVKNQWGVTAYPVVPG